MSTTSTTTQPSTAQPSPANEAPGPPAGLRPWQGSVVASLTRVNLDVVETVDFHDGLFTHRNRVVGGLSSQAIVVLDEPARRNLLVELRAELAAPPAGTDIEALEVFVDLLEASLQPSPSHRFDAARFGAVSHDESTGTLLGQLGLGVDVAGTVHDRAHHLSFEQHVVVLPPGAFRHLGPADRASLAQALRANPPADALWQQILADADDEADT